MIEVDVKCVEYDKFTTENFENDIELIIISKYYYVSYRLKIYYYILRKINLYIYIFAIKYIKIERESSEMGGR